MSSSSDTTPPCANSNSSQDKLLSTGPGTKAFIFFYCMANFFQNFGPNTTTFIIPGEVFPTRYRSTAHGISAASGKLGAIVAQVGFSRLKVRVLVGNSRRVRVLTAVFFPGYRWTQPIRAAHPGAVRVLHAYGYLLDAPAARDDEQVSRLLNRSDAPVLNSFCQVARGVERRGRGSVDGCLDQAQNQNHKMTHEYLRVRGAIGMYVVY